MATPLWQRRLERIIRRTGDLTVDDIRRAAEALRRQSEQPGHDLAWWNETMLVDRELRRARRSRAATITAHRAVEALAWAARRGGLESEDGDVLCIAEALRSLIRATAAGLADAFGADVLGVHTTLPAPATSPSPLTTRRSA